MHAQQLQELSQIIGDIAKSQAEASQSGPNIWQQLLDVLPNLRNPQRVMEIIQQHAMNPHGEQAFIDSPALHDDLASLIDDQSREEFESKEQDDLSAVLMTDQVPGRKRRKGSLPDRHSVTQEWNESEAKTEKPNIEADLGAINDAITNPQTGPALTEKPNTKPKKQYPKIYHRRDSDGNTMAELLEMRDAARGKANKDAVRAKIQKWTAEFDAQSRGAGDFADNTAEQWHEEKRERERNAETVEPTLADDLDAIKAATPNRKQAKDAERAKIHPDEFKPTPPHQQSKPTVPSVPEARTETPTAPDVDLENDPNGKMTSAAVPPVSPTSQPAATTPEPSSASQPSTTTPAILPTSTGGGAIPSTSPTSTGETSLPSTSPTSTGSVEPPPVSGSTTASVPSTELPTDPPIETRNALPDQEPKAVVDPVANVPIAGATSNSQSSIPSASQTSTSEASTPNASASPSIDGQPGNADRKQTSETSSIPAKQETESGSTSATVPTVPESSQSQQPSANAETESDQSSIEKRNQLTDQEPKAVVDPVPQSTSQPATPASTPSPTQSPVSQPTQSASPTPQASQPSQPESLPSRRRRKPKLGPRTEIDDLTDEHAKFHGWAEDEAENRIAQEFPQKMGFLNRFRASRNAILAKILSQNPNRQMPTVDVAPASYTFDRDESSDFLATKQPLVEKYRSENPNATDQDVARYAAGIVTDDEQGLPAHIRQLIATARKEKQQAFYEYLTPEGDVEMSVPVDENLTDSMGRQNSFLHIPSGLAQVSFRPQAEPEFAPQSIDSGYVAQSLRDDLGGVVDAKRQRGMDDADIDRSMRPLVHSYLHDEAGMPQRIAQQIAAAQQQGYVANYEIYNDRNKVLSSARVNHTLQDESGESIIDPQAIMAGRSRIRFTPATFAGDRSQEQEQTATERQNKRQSLVSRWRAQWNQRKQQVAEKRRRTALEQNQQRAEKTQYAHEQRQQQASQAQQQRYQQSMPVESPTLQDDLETIQQAQDHTFNRRPPAQEQTSTPVPGQASQPVAQPAATRRQRQHVPQVATEPQQHENGQPANYDVDDPQSVDDPKTEEQEAEQSGKPSFISRAVDAGQNVLDAIGVVDPTPISDGINAGISLFRGMVTDRGRRKQHMKNAAISTASMVPYIGDTSKIFKAKSMMKAGDAVATSTKSATAARRADIRSRTDSVAGYGFSQAGSGANSPNDPPMPDPTTTAPIRPIGDAREEREGEQRLDGFMDKLKAAGDKLLDFLGPVGKAAGAAFAFVNGLSMLNTGVLAVNRSLEQYNGEIANAYARADMDQIHRDINKGNAMAGPLRELAEQQSELKDTFAQVTVPMQVLLTRMLALVTKGVNYAANATGIPDLISKIATIVGLMPGQDVGITGDWSNFLQDVSDGKFDGKRPVFDQNGRKVRVENILNDQDTKDIFG